MARRRRARVERVPYVSIYPSLRGAVRSMSGAGIQVNRQALGMFLHDRRVERELRSIAQQIAKSAGNGYVVDVSRASVGRSRAAVVGHTYEAIRGERKDKRLSSALAGKRTTPVRPPRPKQNPDPPGFKGERGFF